MSLSDQNIEKLSKALFNRDVLDTPMAGRDTEYRTLIEQFRLDMNGSGETKGFADKLRDKEYAQFGDKQPTPEDKARIETDVQTAIDARIKTHQDRFVAAHKKELMPELSVETIQEEVMGAGGTGMLFGMLSGMGGGIMGALHHVALSFASKLEPVKEMMASVKSYAWPKVTNLFGGEQPELTWEESRAAAKVEMDTQRMLKLAPNDPQAAKAMASVDDAQAETILASINQSVASNAAARAATKSKEHIPAKAPAQASENITTRMDALDGLMDGKLNLNSALLLHDYDGDGHLDLSEMAGKGRDQSRKNIAAAQGDLKAEDLDMLRKLLQEQNVQVNGGVSTAGEKLEYITLSSLPENLPMVSTPAQQEEVATASR